MKKNLIIIYAVPIAILASYMCIHYGHEVVKLEEENRRLSVELSHAQIPLQRETIRDSIEVVKQVVVEVDRKALKDALAADERLIKELQLRIGQLEAMQTTVLATEDTVAATYREPDSLFYYSDQWADLRLSLKDTTFYYNIRDSLATVINRQYRHRFLWWRWGTKGYEVKFVNFNPHAHVMYNRYIKAGK